VTQTKLESDDTTVCDNISDTLIASDNENDTCTSVSEEVDITENEHGNIFAHHVPSPRFLCRRAVMECNTAF
jgi:formaldehyde-activating enzyme involved in methanogenesis